MNIVQPNHIGVIFPYPLHKLFCRFCGAEPVQVQCPGHQAMQLDIPVRADAVGADALAAAFCAAVGQHTLMSLRLQLAAFSAAMRPVLPMPATTLINRYFIILYHCA